MSDPPGNGVEGSMPDMDWSTLAPTALGGLLALGGGLLGQWWAESRAVAREERERLHEREVWARGLRYEAHAKFLALFDDKDRQVVLAPDGAVIFEAPDNYLLEVYAQLEVLRLVSQRETVKAAERALSALNDHVYAGADWGPVGWSRDQYLGAVREEFGLPPVRLLGEADDECA